jgi:gas vesicle protein
MTNNGKVLSALLLGAAAGAVLGLLFAPEKGSDIRKKIQDGAEDLLDQLSDKMDEAKDTLSELKDKGMRAASDLKDNVLSKAERIKQDAEEELKHANNKMKQAQH